MSTVAREFSHSMRSVAAFAAFVEAIVEIFDR